MKLQDISLEPEVTSSNFHLNGCHKDELSRVKSDRGQKCPSGPPLDGSYQAGSPTRTGPMLRQTPLPKLWPVGADMADKLDRKEQKEKERLLFSVKQNNHFNDGLCLAAAHNKAAGFWLPSVSHLCFWHQGSWFFFLPLFIMKTKQSD